ncbi:MAG: hypothetical protein J6W19_06245 [Prevotella sp.]|nr:hypothetical protein [Prevotella sp.]
MKKFLFCVSLVLAGLTTSCIDKYEEVDADSKPSWLGESIYAELKNPAGHGLLTGTFNNYLRLIDDLGYDEVLARTGSKTVFPANDEAFDRFFKSNDWGVTSYEQLTESQKKLLLYSSMLDNALLLGLLPNASNGNSDVLKGQALKHATNVSIIDSVQFITGSGSEDIRPSGMPANNGYWQKYYDKGIHVVSDATRPMMVHLTREYMLANDIKVTGGEESDFAIITGEPYVEGTAYVFNDRVVKGDITCQNGYIHQMENVIVPPGNMTQVLRRKDNTKYFSRILDYFAVPYYDESTTKNYNDWAQLNNKPLIDSIFQVRYLSTRSQGEALNRDPNRQIKSSDVILGFDPGWNQYHPAVANAGQRDISIMDMATIFVPSDEAVKKYFLPGGNGAYLIDIYGNYKFGENNEAHLAENLDSLHSKNPQVLTAFAKNLMRATFAGTVPSKFETVTNDASELLGVTKDNIVRTADGKRDITIANNGALYVLNELIAPDEYQAVLAPASVYPDLRVMNWAIQDRAYLGVDFKFYLLAMRANYGLFIPEDGAFDLYYLDPTSLGHLDNNQVGTQRPDVLHFYYDPTSKTQPLLKCDRYYYDMETGEVDTTTNARSVSIASVKSQLIDILNYHTVVLNEGEKMGSNHYYKTKHGGEIYFEENREGGRVMSGAQIDDPDHFPASVIKTIYNQKNGDAFRLDRVIVPPLKSVYSFVSENDQFSEFLEMCNGFSAEPMLEWAGIPKVNPKNESLPSPQDAYTIFTRDYKLGSKSTAEACLDYNVKMFNTYNYTLFAPDNTAMQQAFSNGLPTWTEVQDLFNEWAEVDTTEMTADDFERMQTAKDMAYMKIRAMRDFVRFHFITGSVYADNSIEGGRYQTLSSDATGVAKEVILGGGNGTLTVRDLKSGHEVSVTAGNGSKLVNKMARDYWFNAEKTQASAIETSSFCSVHQISEPLYGTKTGRFDGDWASRAAFNEARKIYQQLKANNEY